MPHRILQRIHDLSEPLTLAGTQWAALRPDPRARRYPGDATTLITQLKQEFTAEELLAAKVLSGTCPDELLPARALTAEPLDMLFLRADEDSPPYDCVTEYGSLVDHEPPCFEANQDHRTASLLRDEKQLFLVSNVREATVLRQINFPASVVAGLDSIIGAQMRRLCGEPYDESHEHLLVLDRMASIRRGAAPLVFVAFDLPMLRHELPSRVKNAVTRLQKIGRRFGFLTEFLKVWSPSREDLDGIRLAVSLGDLELIRQAIQSSLESVVSLYGFSTQLSRPDELAGAEQTLRAEIRRSRDRKFRSQTADIALRDYESEFVRTVLHPLIEAVADNDPVERPLRQRYAELTAQLHATSPLMKAGKVAGTMDDNPRIDVPEGNAHKLRQELCRELAEIFRLLRMKQ